MNTFRLFTYLGFCTASVWCVTNTPIGEYTLRKFRFIEIPPATERNAAMEAGYMRRIFAQEALSNGKVSGKAIDLEEHFAQFPQGKTFIPKAPDGIDPNLNSQKVGSGAAI